ncbi:MAG: hypothetical protein ABI947_29660 [Chloroflexota bacterium]
MTEDLSFSDLMAVFNFTEEDLRANRQLALSDAQRRKIAFIVLAAMRPLPSLALQLMPIMLLTPIVLIINAVTGSTITANGAVPFELSLFAINLIFWVTLILGASISFIPGVMLRLWGMRIDLSRKDVMMINGRIHLRVEQRKVLKGTTYEFDLLDINGLTFLITDFQRRVLVNYNAYSFHIYYLATSRIILSAEPINR